MPLRGSAIAAISTATITINFPAGSQAGDLAILFVSAGDNVTLPSGWTQLYQTTPATTSWIALAASKVLVSGDISTGSVSINCPAGSFDMAAGLAVFVGAGGGVRETEAGIDSGASVTVTNTTTSAVVSSDTAIYWASQRWTGGVIPVITPGSGSATTLQNAQTTNAWSVLADQAMPGGVLAVASYFADCVAAVAVQVIVEVPSVVNTARSTPFLFI